MYKTTTAFSRSPRLVMFAILGSTLLAAPALACKAPDFAGPTVGRHAAPAADTSWAANAAASPVADAAGLVPADYVLVDGSGENSSPVGMWHAILRLGDAGGPVYDEVLEQFHSDGTELLVSNGLPPALGNICIGVWKKVGGGTFKLRHMTWNWSPPDGGFGVPGSFAGHFELVMTFQLDHHGQSFSGKWTAKNFDLDGEHIPSLDAEGVVKGMRITP